MRTLGWILLVVLLLAGVYAIDSYNCKQKWEKSGFRSTYYLISGCLIETRPGQWIPEKNYRELDR
jgi:hypothetical protein